MPVNSPSSQPNLRYSGQVFLVPTTEWPLAVWAATRSARPVLPLQHETPGDSRAFADSYTGRRHSPILWYQPGAALADGVYNFLHRLPGIKRITVLRVQSREGLRPWDSDNLTAMLTDIHDWSRRGRSYGDGEVQYVPEGDALRPVVERWTQKPTAVGLGLEDARQWLEWDSKYSDRQVRQLYPFARVVIVVPAVPQIACAVVPLAAYLQAAIVYMEPDRRDHRLLINDLVAAVYGSEAVDEIWLVGKAVGLHDDLHGTVQGKRKQLLKGSAKLPGGGEPVEGRIGHVPPIRVIPGEDHFVISEHVAVLLLTYRYLDDIFAEAIKKGREHFFQFLTLPDMHTLCHHCNTVLDLADQLRKRNFAALCDIHRHYWSMTDEERREFIHCYQEQRGGTLSSTQRMVVIADHAADGNVPHHLIDAAAYAARRIVPLLLLQPLPSETSHYIGSLMDKIDDRLKRFGELQIALIEERGRLSEKLSVASSIVTDADDFEETDERAFQNWQSCKEGIEKLKVSIREAQSELHYHVEKTGEVLYESLVPLAMRKTLHELCPHFLVAFVQDPSVPVELIRETGIFTDTGADEWQPPSFLGRVIRQAEAGSHPHHFWGLRYAIGHMSSVNLYETNLTSNISFFAPPTDTDVADLRVLLCSNPTRDLHFSAQEASKIADFFPDPESGDSSLECAPYGQVARPKQRRLLSYDSEAAVGRPTRENLISALRESYEIVHYSGHAFFDNVLPGRSGLVLSDGVLTAADVRFTLDFTSNPVIYANACLAGLIKSVSSRFTGLAAAFIRAGAAGYISPLWSIDDQYAGEMALAYYEELLKGQLPIGQCLQAAKWAQARTESITWASYVLYGDPTLRIIRAGASCAINSEEVLQ